MKIREKLRTSDGAAKRAQKLSNEQLAPFLDTTVMGLGQALDNWRYHGGPGLEVQNALEAINALWEEVQVRGLTNS